MKKFTIKRKEWLRGKKENGNHLLGSCLLDANGRKCCLGFYALKKGFNKKTIIDIQMLSELPNAKKNFPEFCGKKASDSRLASELVCINDNCKTSDAFKEKKIKEKFGKIGVEVNFI